MITALTPTVTPLILPKMHKNSSRLSTEPNKLLVYTILSTYYEKVKAKKKVTYFDDYEVEIFDRFRALRKEIATNNKVPPYVVFSDKTLKELSNVMPTNKRKMLEVHGIGEIKFERYGKAFLVLIEEIEGSL